MIAEPITKHKIWTYNEVREIDDDVRRELHDGEICEMPSPTLNHQDIIGKLYLFLSLWARANGGKAFLSPIDLYVSQTKVYIPDLVFYSAAQMASGAVPQGAKNLTVAPAIIVEVLSRSTARNDRTLKMRAYAEFGIAHYWIIDPVAQTLEAFELGAGRYFLAGTLAAQETLMLDAFPALEIRGADLFPNTDQP